MFNGVINFWEKFHCSNPCGPILTVS